MALKSNDGYTLVESLIAMTLFITVVLGLIGSIGVAFAPSDAIQKEQALVLARNEMAFVTHGEIETETKHVGNFIIEKSVQPISSLYSVTVKVSSTKKEEKPLIVLTKILPAYEQ